jgi:hypothetical protein
MSASAHTIATMVDGRCATRKVPAAVGAAVPFGRGKHRA